MLLIAIALVAGVWFWQRHRAQSGRSGGAAAADSLDLLSPQQLFLRQSALFHAQRPTESLIYARRLSERVPGNWQAHLNYAIALNAAAMEPLRTRASVERVAMLRHAFAELDVADRCTGSPRAHSAIQLQRGDLYRIWGFAADALEAYGSGVGLDPAWLMAQERLRIWTRVVIDPGSLQEQF